MNPKEVLKAVQQRANMRVARRLLAQNGFPRGTGWDQIRDKLKDKVVAAAADYAGLEKSLRELLIVTDKSLRVYPVSASARTTLASEIAALRISSKGAFTSHFPSPVPSSVLSSLPVQTAVPVAKFNTPNVVGIVYSSVHVVEVRVKLKPSQLGVSGQYDEIIAIRREKMQTFDALMVAKNKNYIYTLTDAHFDLTQATRDALQSGLFDAVNKLAGRKVITNAVNLLPLIGPIYNSNDGAVKRLSYTTTTSSGKQEWMRGRGNCLRDELSHKAGMTALSGDFNGYALGIEYPMPEENGYSASPRLEIVGTYRMTYEPNPVVEDALIFGCATHNELESALSELMLHVSGSRSV